MRLCLAALSIERRNAMTSSAHHGKTTSGRCRKVAVQGRLRRLLPIATAGALAALVVGGVAAASAPGDGSEGRDFTALDITIRDTGVDVDNSNSFTVGDEDIFTDVLKNRAGTETIGSLTAICTATEIRSEDERPTAHCAGTVTLSRGTLEFAQLVDFALPTFTLSITGGTGRYDRAHGQITVRFLNETEALYHFDID